MELGGNIELTGFSELSRGEMVIVKKLVGNYARKLSDSVEGFESIKLSTKSVHGGKSEVHVNALVSGKVVASEEIDHNLFFALDKVLKKVVSQLIKE